MTEAIIVATLMEPAMAAGRELLSLPSTVKWLEVRADLTGDLDSAWLRDHFDGKLLYTLRSQAEGGSFQQERKALINLSQLCHRL